MSERVTTRGKIVAIIAVVAALVLAGAVLFEIDRRPRTHDARIFAFSATMASEINGRIVKVMITNDQQVKQGDPLLLIDPKPFEFQLAQARAQVAALSILRRGPRYLYPSNGGAEPRLFADGQGGTRARPSAAQRFIECDECEGRITFT